MDMGLIITYRSTGWALANEEEEFQEVRQSSCFGPDGQVQPDIIYFESVYAKLI